MKKIIAGLITTLTLSALPAGAQSLKTLPFVEQGMTTATLAVPKNAACMLNLPEEPSLLCRTTDGLKYHLVNFTVQGAVDPQALVNDLIARMSQAEPQGKVLERYMLPEISQSKARQDAPLLFRQGQRVVTFAFDYDNPSKRIMGSTALLIHTLPNNGSPITAVTGYGIEVPRSGSMSLDSARKELVRYATSYRYTPEFVQVSNAQHMQFSNDLRARENSFANRQNQIHRDNMQALDDSYNSYMQRSNEQERARQAYRANSGGYDSQQAYVDSIHERQQLIDPETGQRYEADGYRDYNYVNPHDSDMSVRTDDPLYDPNINLEQGHDYRRLEELEY